MKKLAVVLLLLLPGLLHAQDKKIALGIVGSPDVYYYSRNSYYSNEHSTQFTAGARFVYDPGKKITYTTGLYFSTRSYKQHFSYITIEPDPIIPEESEVKLNYVEVPLQVNFYICRGEKFGVYASPFLRIGRLIHHKEMSTMQTGDYHETQYLRNYYSSLTVAGGAALGISYTVSPKISLMLEPYAADWANKYYDMDLTQFYYWIMAGCVLKL